MATFSERFIQQDMQKGIQQGMQQGEVFQDASHFTS